MEIYNIHRIHSTNDRRIPRGYDQVIAKRDRTGENIARKSMTKLYYKLINSFVEDIEFIDGVGDFRLLSQRAVKTVFS